MKQIWFRPKPFFDNKRRNAGLKSGAIDGVILWFLAIQFVVYTRGLGLL